MGNPFARKNVLLLLLTCEKTYFKTENSPSGATRQGAGQGDQEGAVWSPFMKVILRWLWPFAVIR